MVAGLLAAYVLDDLDAPELGHVAISCTTSIAASCKPGETEKHYVLVGRLVTALLMVVAGAA